MFEKASRIKLRFPTEIGELAVEDLWDMPLQNNSLSLDNLARQLHREVKENDEAESFVTPLSTKDQVVVLQFDIVKHIIKVKLDEKAAAVDKEAEKAKKQQILGIIADKQKEQLAGKSVDELKEMLKS